MPSCQSYYVRTNPGFGCARIRLNRNAAGAVPPKKLREGLCFLQLSPQRIIFVIAQEMP